VSLSLREELRVVLYPQQLLLLRIGREFTRRGLTPRVLEKRAVPCAVAADVPWGAAIAALEAELPALAQSTAAATVILPGHFMHYALVPWSAALGDEEEEAAYVRHFFRQSYGAVAESWELRLSPARPGAAQLASAVDSRLTQAVRASFAGAGIRLRSIQPSLMVAYNSCRARLRNSSAWFVLFESGSLCIALLQQGSWGSVRRLRADADWRDALPRLLEREAYLADGDAAADEILLWAPELEPAAWPRSARWKIHALQPALRPGLLPDYDGRFAVAMSG
jgi:hypothetical protein